MQTPNPYCFGAALQKLVIALAFACCLLIVDSVRAAAPTKCTFDLAKGAAELRLKTFSEQSGRSLIMATSLTEGVQTNAVHGEFAPGEALERMLAGTGLIEIEDVKNGAFAIRRKKDHDPKKVPVAADTGGK